MLSEIVYADLPSTKDEDERKQDFRQRVPYFLSELERTGMTRQLLWEEYINQHPDGYRYSQFCHHLLELGKVLQPSFHARYNAGELMMIDFAGTLMSYVDRSTGEQINCPVLICVLPFSNYTYVEALPNARLPALIAALNNCLCYFKGAPLSLKTDNMRQVVQKSNRCEPTFTELIQQWALHNNIALVATRPGKPKDKAPVDSHVKIAYQRIYAPLRDQVFFSIQELNEGIRRQLEVHNNKTSRAKVTVATGSFPSRNSTFCKHCPTSPL